MVPGSTARGGFAGEEAAKATFVTEVRAMWLEVRVGSHEKDW